MNQRFFVLVASAALATTAACGVNKGTHQKVVDELTSCQGALGSCNTDKEAADQKISKLETDLAASQKVAAAREADLKDLSADLKSTTAELGELRKKRAATEKRLAAFRQLNERFRALVDTGKLQVVFRNGQMVLKLPAGVLFPSGKAKLSKAGEAALAEIMDILLEFRDRRFLIAGHTDDRKISGRRFRNNWDLSVARAISVVDFMIKAGFDPRNLGAAGYGEFDPVAPNDTREGRALNRRIEIILVPDLSELPTLAEEAKQT